MDEARTAYDGALKRFRDLAAANATGGNPSFLAETLEGLADLNRRQNRIKEARNDYEEALQIYQKRAEQWPRDVSGDIPRIKRALRLLDN